MPKYVCGSFSELCSVALVALSIFVSFPLFYNYYSFIIDLLLGSANPPLLFFKIAFPVLRFLHLHMNLKYQPVIFYIHKTCWIFLLQLWIDLGIADILLSLPNHEHDMSLHLFRSLISFYHVLECLILMSFLTYFLIVACIHVLNIF